MNGKRKSREREKAKARINKNLPKTKFKQGDFVVITDFSYLPRVNRTLLTTYRNEIVQRVKSHSLILLSMTNHTLRLVSTSNLKRLNNENLEQLDLPQGLKKVRFQKCFFF